MNPSANVQTENVQTANVPTNASHTQVAQTFKPILIKPTDANMRRRLQCKVARDSMTQPVRGLYADSQLWNSLSPNETQLRKSMQLLGSIRTGQFRRSRPRRFWALPVTVRAVRNTSRTFTLPQVSTRQRRIGNGYRLSSIMQNSRVLQKKLMNLSREE